MKRLTALFLSLMFVFSLAAYGNTQGDSNQETGSTEESTKSESSAQTEPTMEPESLEEKTEGNPEGAEGKTLVVYFSMPETTEPDNMTQEEDNSVVVIDGEVLGNTQYVAYVIQENTGADIFRVEPVTPYPTDHDTLVDLAAQEQDDNARPAIKDSIENPEQYDTVFVGYPNWWGDMPMILYSFFDDYDFSGKTIIPFNTHGGSGFSNTISTIAKLEPDANVNQDGFTVSRNNVQDAEPDIIAWLDNLGYTNTDDGGNLPSDISAIASVADVPLLTLNNGVQIPQLGLGTQIQKLEGDSSEAGRQLLNDTSHDAVVAALQSGYRHLDTAHGYYNETGVGQAIIDSGVPREEIWITSKLWPSEYGEGTTMQAIDDMLERLQLDYLDCIYLHHPAGDYMGAWRDLEEAYRQGKVRAMGISNFDNWPEAFNDIMENSEIKPQMLQIECHPFAQRQETRELARQYDLQIECWYPLGHADQRLLNNEVLSEIADAHGKSVVQIILRWHIQEGFSVVPGSTNPDHIQENIEIFDFELSDDEMEQIRNMDQGEDGRYFNINYEQMGGFFTNPIQ